MLGLVLLPQQQPGHAWSRQFALEVDKVRHGHARRGLRLRIQPRLQLLVVQLRRQRPGNARSSSTPQALGDGGSSNRQAGRNLVDAE